MHCYFKAPSPSQNINPIGIENMNENINDTESLSIDSSAFLCIHKI